MLLPTPARNHTTYTRLHHHPPTLKSLENGLGPTGAVPIPLPIWLSINLPLCLPPHPVLPKLMRTSSKTAPDPYFFLLQLQSQNLIKLLPKPCPAASAFTAYKSEEKLRFIISFCAYNYLFHTHLPSPCLASTTSSTFPNSTSSGL